MANAHKKIAKDAWDAATSLVNASPDEIVAAAPKVTGTLTADWKNEIETARNAAKGAGVPVPPNPPMPPSPPNAPQHPSPPRPDDEYCKHNKCEHGPGGVPVPNPF